MPFPDLWPDQVAAYRSGAVCPKDFDAFWAETLAEVRLLPLNARFEAVEVGLPVFDVHGRDLCGPWRHAGQGLVHCAQGRGERLCGQVHRL